MLIIRCVLFLLLIIAPTLFPTETWAQDTLILPPGLEAPCTNMLSPIWYHGMPFDDVDIEIMQHGFKVTLKKDHARHPSIVSFEIFRREQVNTEHVCSALDDRFLVICTETKEQSTAPPLEAWKNWFLTRRDPKKLSEMWVAISNLSSGKSETFHGSPDQRGDAHKQPWSGEHDPAESLILAKPIDTAPWWFRPAGAVSCFLLLALLGFVFNPRRDAIRTMLLLAGASVGTRCIIPYFPIKMKSQILTSLSNIRRDVVSSPFEAFLHFVKNTLGDHMEAFVLPFRFVGAALPILTYLLALRIYGDKKIALTGALVVLLSPVTMGQSSSIIYTQLASPLFFLALLIGQTAVEKNIKIQIPAIIGASLSLVGAMLVKEQFLSLPPLFLVMQGLFIAFSSMEKRKKWQSMIFLGFIPVASCLAVFLLQRYSLGVSFVKITEHKVGTWTQYALVHIAAWAFSFVVLNPPFLPLKIAAAFSLAKPWNRKLIPYQFFIVAMTLVYLNSMLPFGLNRWRYSIILLPPMAILAAPHLHRWLVDWRRHRAFLTLCFVYFLFGWFIFFGVLFGPRAQALSDVFEYQPPPHTLLLAFNYKQNMEGTPYVSLVGRAPVEAVENVWPPSCGLSLDIMQAMSREIDKIEFISGLKMNNSQYHGGEVNLSLCKRDIALFTRRLAPYEHIVFFVDPLFHEKEFLLLYRIPPLFWEASWHTAKKAIELASEPTNGGPRFIEVTRIKSPFPGDADLWRANADGKDNASSPHDLKQ